VLYPAIDLQDVDTELVFALLDDYSPTAIEERGERLRAFFAWGAARDAALRALTVRYRAESIDVSDEDWARRSQQNLAPTSVGRITVHPTDATVPESLISNHQSPANPESRIPNPDHVHIVIAPSMGFGTGHHATTRLCLAALQEVNVRGRTVLDVGTGSGVLAIAAVFLGAARATGLDVDADAIRSANENLALNPAAVGVDFICADLAAAPLPRADVITANLTGGLLQRSAAALLAATNSGGVVIVSGLMRDERDEVVRAFAPAAIVWERFEDEWAGLAVKRS
jgi:ribosomal protein L11 methyltransferase